MANLPPFTRSKDCNCKDCITYCKTIPGYLVPGDLFAIADSLIQEGGITTRQEIFSFLRASRGAIVGEAATGRRFRIGTITPKMVNGRCIFLTPEDRCSIHSVAPFACGFFDPHMDPIEGNRRSMWGLKQISITPAYEQLRQKLIADAGEAEPFTSKEDADANGAP
jgi:Fe-S-cluster containining protein